MATRRKVKEEPASVQYVIEVGYYKDKTFAEAKKIELERMGLRPIIRERKNEN